MEEQRDPNLNNTEKKGRATDRHRLTGGDRKAHKQTDAQ